MKIYDTTLRDGAQSRDVVFSVSDKVQIVKALDMLGVDYIELGWPGSNIKDMETFRIACKLNLHRSRISAFGSTRRPGITADMDKNLQAIVESGAKSAAIFGKTWMPHIEQQLRISAQDNLACIEDSIRYLCSKGIEVFFDAEHFFDGFKQHPDYSLQCLSVAAMSGASCVVLCDTNGGCLPQDIQSIVMKVKEFLRRSHIDVEIGLHCHNDSGCAVANSLIVIDHIDHIQGTINGIGERVGNADLCSIIPAYVLKRNGAIDIRLNRLKEVSDLICNLANIRPNENLPYVGKNAFSHKGGIHVDAISKGASYEHIDPESVGNRRDIVLSELSGKANIIGVAKSCGFEIDKNDPKVAAALDDIKQIEKKGYNIGSLEAERQLLIYKHFGGKEHPFQILTWKIMSEHRDKEYSECILTAEIDGHVQAVAAPVSGGPVESAYRAVQSLLVPKHPEVGNLKLMNYKVVIAEDKGPESTVRVYIEFADGTRSWGNVGVSANILEASLEAIKKGFCYYLWKIH